MNVDERPKDEIVSRVLERIAEGRYRSGDEDNGEVIIIPDYGPTLPEREGYFSQQHDKLEKMRDGSEGHDEHLALSEDWTDYWTLRLLEQEPFGPEDTDRLFPILKGKSYGEVLICLHAALTDNLEKAEQLLAAGRETVPHMALNEMSGALDDEFRDNLHERLSGFHARRLSKEFTEIIDRAVGLALLTADYEVPNKLKRYIEEASKSYLNGQWIACLVVCRSAIEFAVRDRLIASGYGSELEQFKKSPNRNSLSRLIDLAKKHMQQYQVPLEYAHEVRDAANRAVHSNTPRDDECRDLFVLTRMVMSLLYREA